MHTDTSKIKPGWTVIDALGENIGNVEFAQSNYILVSKGLIFPKELYIPLDAVDKVDATEGTVALNVHKGDIDETEWSQAPAESYGEVSGRTADDAVLTAKEERVRTDKARKKTGEVAVGKRVVEQDVDMEVPVTREEVDVTRRRVDRPAGATDTFSADDGTIRVPVTAEEVSVRKEPRVVEEVVVSKRPVTETQRVSETARREEITVDEQGDARLHSDAATRRDAYARDNTTRAGADDEDVAGPAGGAAAGAVGGAAVGAAVGGPPGAVVGGAVGAAGGAVAGDAVEDEIDDEDSLR
jgi:uncharacterized protein (TIGR02271 family)